MRKPITIVTSLALCLMPVMASAKVHSHHHRQAVVQTIAATDDGDAAFQALYRAPGFAQQQPGDSSCQPNCQPALMYGIGY